ncbi:hypothetical protein NDU88_003061 [Pleurodeles waltl]|uniref:Uncharacterized protein n=1 Tax=Pleurodeles waltl TaxID=8319 RepID=A0AAV7NPV9_PLEWA|nr:hypothetical protein NDU88_003061 [Pleurodeles waltl]
MRGVILRAEWSCRTPVGQVPLSSWPPRSPQCGEAKQPPQHPPLLPPPGWRSPLAALAAGHGPRPPSSSCTTRPPGRHGAFVLPQPRPAAPGSPSTVAGRGPADLLHQLPVQA